MDFLLWLLIGICVVLFTIFLLGSVAVSFLIVIFKFGAKLGIAGILLIILLIWMFT